MQRLGISDDATEALRRRSALEAERREFCSKLSLMKYEAGRLGLFYTMQRLGPAIRMVGYEVAGTPERCEESEAQMEARRP